VEQFKLIDELPDLIDHSIELLREHEPEEGYYGCFSGGKDSVVIKELARMAGVKVAWHYNKTTIDPPELVRFIRREHPDVKFVRHPDGNFFSIMERRGFPTRRVRWCCKEFKEAQSPKGATIVLGVRAEESPARATRWSEVVNNHRTALLAIMPIFRWASDEIWEFIRDREIAYCRLYDEGFYRLGCIGCPMAGKLGREKEFARWPKYERLWRRTFQRIWERKAGTTQRDGREWFGSANFDSWTEMWDWWMSDHAVMHRRDEPLFEAQSAAGETAQAIADATGEGVTVEVSQIKKGERA
jgi:phosphoadenosine phosphosulfate reductase